LRHPLNRLLGISGVPGAANQLTLGFAYVYNDANQRRRATSAEGSFWIYQYDNLGQVISGKKYWADGTPVAGQQFEYAFDDIGNRTSTKAGGDQNGINLQTATYTSNLLNQYAQRTVPGAAPVIGLAEAASTVSVNSLSAYRKGEYFWKELPEANSSAPVWQSISVHAVNGINNNTITGNEFVPKTPELFTYDLDGNLLGDGRWTYTWDAENRLIRMVAATAVGPQQRIDFEYDAGSRRIRKTVWNNTAGTGTPALAVKFLYDGWNVIAELDALSSDAVVRSYLWGLDLSGSFQGAGGVGGLLAVKSGGVCHFALYNGNGDVIGLVDASSGNYSAQYEYGPFGETIRATGPMAKINPYHYSTKYQDEESGFSYYGYRYYNPRTGGWLNLDPLEEQGGYNLYAFVNNDSPTSIDYTGLTEISVSAGLGLGLRVSGSVTLESSQENGMRVIKLTAEGSAGVGVALKGHGKAFGKTFGVGFDFEGPSFKEKRIIKVTISCDGYVNFHSSIDLVRLSADQTFGGGIGLGFVAIHAEVNLHLNGGLAWEINAVPHVLSTWLEWNREKGASYKITGGFGENTDVVLDQGKSPDSHTFHKLIAGPLIFKF
jgi:RHS repeat-associated protein